MYPEYKANRRIDLTDIEKRDLTLAFRQFDDLKKKVLPRLGFANIFYQKKYQ